MVAGLEPVVVFWSRRGIHFMVLLSFTVQVTLLLLADLRRRTDWAWLKGVIWSAYMLADTTAIYALGHMSVVCRSTEHQLMALWAPLLLVHLGGQDNITAYAIEDNRLWLRHLQTFVLQVAAAGYVLYVSSILSYQSNLRLAAILMLVVGVLKYGERIWALKCANSCASSSLSATSYDKGPVARTASEGQHRLSGLARAINSCAIKELIVAHSLLDVPKQMFEGPTSYVDTVTNSEDARTLLTHHKVDMLEMVQLQLWMMYDLLYTKAAVVHTWYGLCSRVLVSLPFTVAALMLFRSSSMSHGDRNADAALAVGDVDYYSKRSADVAITNALLTGAVVLETMSVLRAIFSKWTAILMYARGWYIIGTTLFNVDFFGFSAILALLQITEGEMWWSGRMRQHSLFKLVSQSDYSTGSKMAKRIGVEDWWDSNVYSWSTEVPKLAIAKVLKLVSSTTIEEIKKSWGHSALCRSLNNNKVLVNWIWTEEELELEERILAWHIATHVYMKWYYHSRFRFDDSTWDPREAIETLANYMFFLMAARPYMLPYPVSRRVYVELCSDAITHFRGYTESKLLEALLKGTALQPDKDIVGRLQGNGGETGAAVEPQPQRSVNTTTLDRACQLVAKLIHITAAQPIEQRQQTEETVDGNEDIITGQTETFSVNNGEVVLNKLEYEVVLNMILDVWTEMLCYTAYLCNENYHARHLTDGGEIMTIISLLMIYVKNGLVGQDTSTSGTAAGTSSSQGATATDI